MYKVIGGYLLHELYQNASLFALKHSCKVRSHRLHALFQGQYLKTKKSLKPFTDNNMSVIII